jgi:glycosyltransferase involved in cell wall biosynthesis
VLHVIRRLDLAGGAERIVAELVREVPGHDVLIFDGGTSVYDLGAGKLLRARNLAHALWMCLRLKRQYDIFHLHLPPSIYLAIPFGKRAVIHEHNTHLERRRKFLPRVLSRIAMERAAAVIAVGESVRNAIVGGGGKRARVFSLPNFVANLPDAQDTSSGSTNLLMVAAFRAAKRQDQLIRALPFMPEDIRVSFAGDGPNLPTYRRLAEDLCVAHRIDFLGSVRDISKHYANARLCVLLSDWEGFGLVVLEAARFGKATVVSDIIALREFCVDDRLLFTGSSAKELADKLMEAVKFCGDQNLKQRLADILEDHDLFSYAKKLNAIYEAV